MGVVCQFSPTGGKAVLKDYIDVPEVYPAGRLDTDSEGLLLLTNDGSLQHRISSPGHKWPKTYWVQVEGTPSDDALRALSAGVLLSDGLTLPAQVQVLDPPPVLWPRVPPIRQRKLIPDHWLAITLTEGRNRQVRRMTAAVGLPTLRLVRWAIGPYTLDGLAPGNWQDLKIIR